jgi:hypothetical protein
MMMPDTTSKREASVEGDHLNPSHGSGVTPAKQLHWRGEAHVVKIRFGHAHFRGVHGLSWVGSVDLSVERIGRSALYQTLNFGTAEVLGTFGQVVQANIGLQEVVIPHLGSMNAEDLQTTVLIRQADLNSTHVFIMMCTESAYWLDPTLVG